MEKFKELFESDMPSEFNFTKKQDDVVSEIREYLNDNGYTKGRDYTTKENHGEEINQLVFKKKRFQSDKKLIALLKKTM